MRLFVGDMNTNGRLDVAIALPVFTTFTYRVPDHLQFLARAGVRVLAPFGQRKVTGYILGKSDGADLDQVKFILDVLDETPLFPESMIPFFKWVADYYLYPIGEVIQTALPSGLSRKEVTRYTLTDAGKHVIQDSAISPVQQGILQALQSKPTDFKGVSRAMGISIARAVLLDMERNGWIAKTQSLQTETTRRRQEMYVTPMVSDIRNIEMSRSQKRIMETILSYGDIPVRELKRRIPSASKKLSDMESSGWLRIAVRTLYRDPFGDTVQPDTPRVLTSEQQDVVTAVESALGKGYRPFLLKGVTGSGKTEVYLQLADKVMQSGRNVLVLVPEIALISQLERCFRARFGNRVSVLHSGLSAGERFDQWNRIAGGHSPIVIGARSAVFAPFEHLGLIVVDEEHDSSYKQDSGLHYNARDIALVRARMDSAIALLGSATPSLQSYHHVMTHKFYGVTLSRRIENRPLPRTRIVDLRQFRDQRGIWKIISPELHEAMTQTLSRGEQVLLFLNRRGFASSPVCAACGEPMHCKNCSISMTLHQTEQVYKCHYCGATRPSTSPCTICGSSHIKRLGMGTEKIEAAVRILFPQARIARMDRDTVSRKGALLGILKDLRNRNTDILIGTQMVAKGHDFPYITLVGVICADISFNYPDFRSSERMFQLLLQVSGRAGRGESPGEVILQTYNPGHFIIAAAMRQDYEAFYEKEIRYREKLKYPPCSRLIQIKFMGKDSGKTRDHALHIGALCQHLKKNQPAYQSVEVLGPIEAYLPRIAAYHRWQILLKSVHTAPLRQLAREMIFSYRRDIQSSQVSVSFDVDPIFML